jgi:hypothetical protein
MANGKWPMANAKKAGDVPAAFGISHLAFGIWHLAFGI